MFTVISDMGRRLKGVDPDVVVLTQQHANIVGLLLDLVLLVRLPFISKHFRHQAMAKATLLAIRGVYRGGSLFSKEFMKHQGLPEIKPKDALTVVLTMAELVALSISVGKASLPLGSHTACKDDHVDVSGTITENGNATMKPVAANAFRHSNSPAA